MNKKDALGYTAQAIDQLYCAVVNISGGGLEYNEDFEEGKKYMAIGPPPVPDTELDVYLSPGEIYECSDDGVDDDKPMFSGMFYSNELEGNSLDDHWIWMDVAKTFLIPVPTDEDEEEREKQEKDQSTLDKIKELISEEE